MRYREGLARTLERLKAGTSNPHLVVDFLGEYPEDYWQSMPNLADSERGRIPLTFAMRAYKPH